MDEMREIKISRIKNGTVLDHIKPGTAIDVFQMLALENDSKNSVSIAIRVNSDKMGQKDLLKVEDRFLTPKESAMVALISPQTTINIIKDYQVQEKRPVELPERLKGTIRCGNPNCITNTGREPATAEFKLISRDPLSVRCLYCGNIIEERQIKRSLVQRS